MLLTLRPDYAENPFDYCPQLYHATVAGLAGLALVVWYLLLRRQIGPAALAGTGLVWLALLGVLTARAVPGESHLFTLPLLGLTGAGLVAPGLPRQSGWAVLAMVIGTVAAIVLLMPLRVGTLDATGLALGGVAAALLTLFGLTLLPFKTPY